MTAYHSASVFVYLTFATAQPTPPSFTSSSVDHPRRRSYQHNDLPTIATLDDDLSSCESSPEAEVTSTEHPPAKRHVHSSQRNPKSSTPACISSVSLYAVMFVREKMTD